MIAFAGLPGSGKSTLARLLAAELGVPRLDKDEWRERLFGRAGVEYSRAQDDEVMRQVYAEAERLASGGEREVVLDGRTYSRRSQVEALRACAARAGAELVLVECVCALEVARARVERERALGAHPAANRDGALVARLAAEAEPISAPKFVLATDSESPERLLARLLRHLGRS
jgi:adenylylsulfate kinase